MARQGWQRWMVVCGVLVLASSAGRAAGAAPPLGDVTGDGKVDVTDALAIARSVAQVTPPVETSVADVDCNGRVTIVDAMLVSRYSAGLIVRFPCPVPTRVGAGIFHTLAIGADGQLLAWGSNGSGQLGDGRYADLHAPTRIGYDRSWVMVAAGGEHSVALKADGTLWAWGDDTYGQLGIGASALRTDVPQQIGTDTNWSYVAAGVYHTFAVKKDGTLWGWGMNLGGELGDGNTVNQRTPERIGTDSDWSWVSSYWHTVALKRNGTLWAWGPNGWGQIGIGVGPDGWPPDPVLSPVQVGTDSTWAVARAGRHHTVAIKQDGTLWAWGENTRCELGDGTSTGRYVPTLVGATPEWSDVAAGVSYTIAIKKDGTLWASGLNATCTRDQVGQDADWLTASANYHTVALKQDGAVWAWGTNDYGQVGDGTTTPRDTPTPVPY